MCMSPYHSLTTPLLLLLLLLLPQVRDVDVYRYIASDTLEERMLELQERKRELSAAAFDRRSAEEDRQSRVEDVRLLMRL